MKKLVVHDAEPNEVIAKHFVAPGEPMFRWMMDNLHSDGIEVPGMLVNILDATPEELRAWFYLSFTDFYVIREAETGEEIPAGISTKRADARLILDG